MINLKTFPPLLIVTWRVFLSLIYYSDFYYYNYKELNDLDTIFIVFFIIHFCVNIKYYLTKNIIFVLYIVSFLQLFLIKSFLSIELYYVVYTLILIVTVWLSIIKKNVGTLT